MTKNVLVHYSKEIENTKAARSFLDKFLNKQTEIWTEEGGDSSMDIAAYALDHKYKLVAVDDTDATLDLIDFVLAVVPTNSPPSALVKKAIAKNKFICIGMIPK
jgi:hypothetical protein